MTTICRNCKYHISNFTGLAMYDDYCEKHPITKINKTNVVTGHDYYDIYPEEHTIAYHWDSILFVACEKININGNCSEFQKKDPIVERDRERWAARVRVWWHKYFAIR